MNQQLKTNFFTRGIGDNVLFLHGWGGTCDSFCNLTKQFDQKFRIISIDFWGFGKSDNPPESGWGVKEYALALKDFLDEHKFYSVTIIAHSFGGRVAIMLASLFPQIVDKLILVDSAGLKKFSLKRGLKIALFKMKRLLVKIGLLKHSKLNKQGSNDYKALSETMRTTFKKVVNQNLSDYAKKISCPTLLIWGQNDLDTPIWMARKLNRLIPNSGLVIFKNSGHFSYIDEQDRFVKVVQSFLDS